MERNWGGQRQRLRIKNITNNMLLTYKLFEDFIETFKCLVNETGVTFSATVISVILPWSSLFWQKCNESCLYGPCPWSHFMENEISINKTAKNASNIWPCWNVHLVEKLAPPWLTVLSPLVKVVVIQRTCMAQIARRKNSFVISVFLSLERSVNI